MEKRPLLAVVLALALTACTATPATPAIAPAPPAAPSAPAQPTPAQTPAPQPASPQPTPPEPSPASALRPTPDPNAPTPALLQRLLDAQWAFDAVVKELPPLESRIHDKSGENPDFTQYAYALGRLRVSVSAQGRIIGVLVDTADPAYESWRVLPDTEQYVVRVQDRYVVILPVRPALGAEPYQALAAQPLSLAALTERLGTPSYRYHLHGLGHFVYVWLDLGLQAVGSEQKLTVAPAVQKQPEPKAGTYAEYISGRTALLDGFAAEQAQDLTRIYNALAKGKGSPDRKRLAVAMQRGGYWDNWIIIQRPGQAELRVQADYFLQWYDWLDDQTLLFGEVPLVVTAQRPFALKAIDARTGQVRVAAKITEEPTGFGIVNPHRIWYQTRDHGRVEIDLP